MSNAAALLEISNTETEDLYTFQTSSLNLIAYAWVISTAENLSDYLLFNLVCVIIYINK